MQIFGVSEDSQNIKFKLGKENAKDFVSKIDEVIKKEILKKLLGLETPLLKTWFGGKKFSL